MARGSESVLDAGRCGRKVRRFPLQRYTGDFLIKCARRRKYFVTKWPRTLSILPVAGLLPLHQVPSLKHDMLFFVLYSTLFHLFLLFDDLDY